ncbi:MAG: FHA domain-containing protein [Isosphaeraceae bacterium]
MIPLNGDPPIPIRRDLTIVGRREFCDVRVDHPSLSKRHCLVVRTDGLLMVRDLASTNGTKVNGQKVFWAALLPNDRLTLGKYKFRIYLGPDDARSPSEEALVARQTPAAAPADFVAPTPAGNAASGEPYRQADPIDSEPMVISDDDLWLDDSDEEPILLELD